MFFQPVTVRKSTKGETLSKNKEEKETDDCLPPTSLKAPSSLNKTLSMLSNDAQPEAQKTEEEVEASSQTDISTAGHQQPHVLPKNQTVERCVEGGAEEKQRQSRADIKGTENPKMDSLLSFPH